MAKKPKPRLAVLGHRGSRGTHPENTLASFEEAISAGADGIEFDIQFTRDERCVIHHDPKISRKHCTLNGTRPRQSLAIAELNFETIRQYDCGATFQRLFPKQKLETRNSTPILSLEEFFEWAKQQDSSLEWVVELKMPPLTQRKKPSRKRFVESVCATVRHYKIAAQVVFQSFDHKLLEICAIEMPEVCRSYLYHQKKNFADHAHKLGATRVSPNFRLLNKKTAARCQELGLVLTPYTVNTPAAWKTALQLNVDALITDYPRKLVNFLASER